MNFKSTIIFRQLLGLTLLATTACLEPAPDTQPPDGPVPSAWLDEDAEIFGEIPAGWDGSEDFGSWHFYHDSAPGHVISIQNLTVGNGRGPLKMLSEAIKNHPYFSNFKYESKWERRLDGAWAPSYHATYLYLDQPAVRYGCLVPTSKGFYEISYHAPYSPHADAIAGYESLIDSITLFRHD